jgi:hypothetical protein
MHHYVGLCWEYHKNELIPQIIVYNASSDDLANKIVQMYTDEVTWLSLAVEQDDCDRGSLFEGYAVENPDGSVYTLLHKYKESIIYKCREEEDAWGLFNEVFEEILCSDEDGEPNDSLYFDSFQEAYEWSKGWCVAFRVVGPNDNHDINKCGILLEDVWIKEIKDVLLTAKLTAKEDDWINYLNVCIN